MKLSFFKQNRFSGILAVLFASLMWALEAILSKLSMQTASVAQTNMTRVGVVALAGLFYALLTDRKSLKLSLKQMTAIGYISVVGTIFADLVYLYCLTKVPVVHAVLIGHLQPIFIVILGIFFLKEDRFSKWEYFGIGIMILSALLVTTATPENLIRLRFGLIEDLYVLLATAAWATAGIAARKYVGALNSGAVTFYRFFIAFIAMSFYLFLRGEWLINNPYQIIVGVIVGIGYILYYEGLKRMQAAVVGAMELSTPFFAALLGFIILGETVTWMQMAGICSLIGGVVILSKK